MINEPIRVAQVVGSMNGGGVEAVVMNYFKNIDRSKIQFDFIVNDDSTAIPYEEIEQLGGRVVLVSGYRDIFRYIRTMKRLFLSGEYKVVHSHVNALSIFPLYCAKVAGIDVRIAHSHSTSGKGEWAKNIFKGMLKPLSNLFPTHRIACSQKAGDWLFGEGSSYRVLHNAINLDDYAFSSSIRAKIRVDLNIDESVFVIGHVGRFVAQKNHKKLIEIFRHFCAIQPDSLLVLVGDGPLFEETKDRAMKVGIAEKIIFLGQRDDVSSLYQAFDAFVLPSLYEGLPLVGVEAQRAGLDCYFGNTITREVDLGRATFLPIGSDSHDWAKKIDCARFAYYEREIAGKDLNVFSEYDIKTASKKLLDLYLKCFDDKVR